MDYSEEITEKYVDINKVLASKGVKLPAFAVRWTERLLCLDRINSTIYRYRDIKGLDFIHTFLEGSSEYDLNVKLDLVGTENIPTSGYPMMAGNHPLGGPDGMAVIAAVGHYRSDIKFPVNDFLMYLPGPRPLFVPIDKVHHSTNVDTLEAAFADKNILLYFPAGMCSRKRGEVIRDLEWKPTIIKKAVRYQRDIIPFFVDAQNSNKFYRLANLRERLGIKFNIEMALLPSEMFKQKNKTIRIVFGKPIPYQTFDNRYNPRQWAALLKEYVYTLDKDPLAQFPYLLKKTDGQSRQQ